jgi:hypothetical protein
MVSRCTVLNTDRIVKQATNKQTNKQTLKFLNLSTTRRSGMNSRSGRPRDDLQRVQTGREMKCPTFCYVMPYSLLEVNRRFGITILLHLQGGRTTSHARNLHGTCFMLLSCLACCSATLKMKSNCSPITLPDFQRLHGAM